jgi:hypothetical protein
MVPLYPDPERTLLLGRISNPGGSTERSKTLLKKQRIIKNYFFVLRKLDILNREYLN